MAVHATSTGEPVYECLWPLGNRASKKMPVAPRVPDLNGRTIAEFWDFLFQGDVMFPAIRAELKKRFPGVKFVGYDTFGSTNGPGRDRILNDMSSLLREHKADAVISGIGA